jgi:type I restriction enzyme M protein
MTAKQQEQLGKTLWAIADGLRGAMNADDFRDYMLSFLFLRYLSDNYEAAAKKELGKDYPAHTPEELKKRKANSNLQVWYNENAADVAAFEQQMRKKVHYVVEPPYLWSSIAEMARTQNKELLETLRDGFKYIEEKSFENVFMGLFSEINLNSEKLGRTPTERNERLCDIIKEIAKGIAEFSSDVDLGDAYEFLLDQFAAGSGKKAGEFYTPKQISSILSQIVVLDPQDPSQGPKKKLSKVLDMTCGSGSLLLNVRNVLKKRGGSIGKLYGQEKNITTYNLARMNMLLHGVKDTEFAIHHGDTLKNDWELLNEINPAKKVEFDAIVANPPFSLRWDPSEEMAKDFRFANFGLAPKSAADFAFLLHGFHFLSDKEGTMAIILPHGVLFRGGAEQRIREKLLKDNNIDTVIGLPGKLFYSTGIPVCIVVLKKCKKFDDVLFINASEEYVPGKRQNSLDPEKHIKRIVDTYQYRPERIERYARRVSMAEIEENDFNLNISRYVSNAKEDEKVDLGEVHKMLEVIDKKIKKATMEHNKYLKELGLKPV